MIAKFIKENADSTLVQILRYSLTGTVAIGADYYCLYMLHSMHVHYLTAVAVAYFVGIIVNYYLSTKWVFNGKKSDLDPVIELIIFTVIGIIGLGFSEVLIWFFTGLYGIHILFSKTFATMIVSLWNFFARKKLLFS